MPSIPQAIIRIVPRGGARSVTQLAKQWKYLSRKGEVPLDRSQRHLGVPVPKEQLKQIARSWIVQTGMPPIERRADPDAPELTTHIVISFPPHTDVPCAFAAGRAWAEEMFGSGRHGGTFDYLTACHSDRPHPHVHLVINRRALEGHWLKISRRHPHLNYDQMRLELVDIAKEFGISLESTSRIARGIEAPAITYAEFRRRARARAD